VTSWLAHYGVLAVFLLMLIDAVFPAASELVMVYAGALASGALTHTVDVFGWHTTGLSAYLLVVAAGVVGYQIGADLGWWIGDRGGRPFLERHGRWLHLTHERIDRADRWFDRWDDWAVFLGRITPVARSFISIPAGVFEMRFAPYALYSLLGSLPWAFGFAAAGVALGNGWERVHNSFRWVDYVVVGLIVAGIAYLIVRTVRRRARRGAEPPEEQVGSGELE